MDSALLIVDGDTIKTVNRDKRGVDAVTDVLSFPYLEKLRLPAQLSDFSDADKLKGRALAGDILICRERATEQATAYEHSYRRELGFLACHGILHLMGFDHIDPEDEKVMTSLQRAVMADLRLER